MNDYTTGPLGRLYHHLRWPMRKLGLHHSASYYLHRWGNTELYIWLIAAWLAGTKLGLPDDAREWTRLSIWVLATHLFWVLRTWGDDD